MDPVQVIQGQIEAFNARDLECFLSYYDPDALIEDGENTPLARGHDALRLLFEPLFAQSPELHATMCQRILVGPYVIDEAVISGFNFTGLPPDLHGAVVFRVEGTVIVHARLLMS